MKGSKVPDNTQHNLHVLSVFELSRYMPDHSIMVGVHKKTAIF